ncbi:MAG TPA: hypothetical protein VFX64_04470 [Candidatus Nitrosotalea sp.]|nr:hypothetical protein [Candidatus Nitrosotalea sp.]
MSNVLLKSVIILSIIVGSIFAAYTVHLAYAAPEFVTVTSTNTAGTTVISVSNNASNTADITSFTLQINGDGTFKSFKTENGWQGIKTSTALAFSTTIPLKPGNTASFEIKTDQQEPTLTWTTSDANNVDRESGQIGVQPGTTVKDDTGTSKSDNTNKDGGSGSTTQPTPRGILDTSTFRIIPSSPSPGSHIRVVGQSFSSSANLDLYVGNDKIDTFASNDRGNFVTTVVLPDSEQPGSVNFVVKDLQGNTKTFSTNIKPQQKNHLNTQQYVPLTLDINPIYHRGDTKIISGMATPEITITLTFLDSKGNPITTSTVTTDKDGKYSMSDVVPVDIDFGKYTVTASDGKTQVTKQYSIVTTHNISLSPSATRYESGQTVFINGTSISNQLVHFVIMDPTDQQIYAQDENVTSQGTVSMSYKIEDSAMKGTYTVDITQGNDLIVTFFGVGQEVDQPITATLDKLSYQNTDKPVVSITGPASSTINLIIVDPSDKQKFADIINLGSDGQAAYSFNLTSYTPGIYSAVVSHAEEKVEKSFAVGLATNTGTIKLNTVKDSYLPGDNIIIIGTANANSLLQITLTDPTGQVVKSVQTFTDKTGHFSSFDFNIPSVAVPGTWKLDGASGVNHNSVPIIVKSSKQAIIVHLDRPSGTYTRGDIVEITGSDAGVTASVKITINSNSTVIDTLPTSATNRGDYVTDWQVPRNVNPGQYTVEASSITGKAVISITIQ